MDGVDVRPTDLESVMFRAAIEDDYAKRLAKLAKLTLGRDEIGLVLVTIYLCGWPSAS